MSFVVRKGQLIQEGKKGGTVIDNADKTREALASIWRTGRFFRVEDGDCLHLDLSCFVEPALLDGLERQSNLQPWSTQRISN